MLGRCCSRRGLSSSSRILDAVTLRMIALPAVEVAVSDRVAKRLINQTWFRSGFIARTPFTQQSDTHTMTMPFWPVALPTFSVRSSTPSPVMLRRAAVEPDTRALTGAPVGHSNRRSNRHLVPVDSRDLHELHLPAVQCGRVNCRLRPCRSDLNRRRCFRYQTRR